MGNGREYRLRMTKTTLRNVWMRCSPYLSLLCLLLLSACGPSQEKTARLAEEQRVNCLDALCNGDVAPAHDLQREVALKLNGRWYIGPTEYFSSGINGASFEWWNRKVISRRMQRPTELRLAAENGESDRFSIEIFLRSTTIPQPPYGYALIELAEKNGWIASRSTLRRGLDKVEMKHVVGQRGHYVDHVTYYVATELKGSDGLPPVATCSHEDPRNGGGSGFMWKPGIWAGIRMNQKHCADWPEIYLEVSRVLQLLKGA